MWTYTQQTGELRDADDQIAGVGYSGHEQGKNNPTFQNVKMTGPIPCGTYAIGEPFGTEMHGPHVMHLTPLGSTQTFGRGGFLIHGDSIKSPGEASEGCIILLRSLRERIWGSGDHTIHVVSGMVPDLDGEIAT